MNPETHAGTLVGASASLPIPFLTFLDLPSLGCLGFPNRELGGLESRGCRGGCSWGPNFPALPFSFVLDTRVTAVAGLSQLGRPQSAPRASAQSRWMTGLPPATGLGHPLPRPRPPSARCPHATLSLNCANICCAPTVSRSRASLPPPSRLPRRPPLPARLACRLRDSRRRSPGPAGAA